MRAYVLAGGLGTRLRDRLGSVPKVLAPFDDRTFLEVQLEWLAECGVIVGSPGTELEFAL